MLPSNLEIIVINQPKEIAETVPEQIIMLPATNLIKKDIIIT
jgi:hypothetical protein